MQVDAIVPAAGQGLRLGLDKPKALLEVAGAPLVVHALARLCASGVVAAAVVAAPPEHVRATEELLARRHWNVPLRCVAGGPSRQDSVRRALAAVRPAAEIVVVHDAARPLVSPGLVARVVQAAASHGAALAVVPVADTIKVVDGDGRALSGPPRASLRAAQTPQAFRTEVLRRAHALAVAVGWQETDDAALVEKLGVAARAVPGEAHNIKVTTPEDLQLVALLLAEGK